MDKETKTDVNGGGATEPSESNGKSRTCSFCGRGKDEVKRFFTANGNSICPECIVAFHKDLG